MTARLWVRGAVTVELGVGKTAGEVFCRVGGDEFCVGQVKCKLPRSNRQLGGV